jgi:predicted porin
MKLTTLAAAAATVAATGIAHAQVQEPNKNYFTVYGIADVSAVFADSGFGNKVRFDGGGGMQASRLGFRANRTFDSGITALAVMEAGVQFSTGSVGTAAPVLGLNDTNASSGGQTGTGSRFFARQIYGGLRGSFGTVSIGRQYTGSYFGGVGMGSAAWPDGFYGQPGSLLPLVGGMPTRVDNSIAYLTPNWGGLEVLGTFTSGVQNNISTPTAVGSAATTQTDKSGQGWDLLVRYRNGPLGLGASTWRVNNGAYNVTAGETSLAKKTGVQLFGYYDFGWALVSSILVTGKINGGNYETVTKTLSNSSGWALSARVPVTADKKHNIWVAYSALNDKSLLNRDAKLYGVAYWYQMEPSTRLYASWGQIKNNSNGLYALSDGGNLTGNVTTPGVKAKGIQVGINYNF